jgi:hypothetical protein
MPLIILIDKTGTIKETSLKQYVESDLYKKAGFKTPDHFKLHTTWAVEINAKKYSVSLYGKTEGKANQENKYDFPPPVDNILFFGSCILVNKNENGEAGNISESEWEQIYEKLFGGFEDIGSSDSEEEEEDEYDGPTTKEGYAKDGFVIGDDDDEIDDYDESGSDNSEPEIKTKSKKTVKKQSIKETIFMENDYLDCKSELSEEDYFE